MMNCRFAFGSGLLRQDRRVAAVGGSDSHGKHQPVGSPQTVVHADGLSAPAIVAGGCVAAVRTSLDRAMWPELTASTDDGVAGPGQTLRVAPGASVTVTAVISGAPGTTVALITAAGRVRQATVGPSARLQWQLDAASARFARLEVREAQQTPARRDGRVDKSGVVRLSASTVRLRQARGGRR